MNSGRYFTQTQPPRGRYIGIGLIIGLLLGLLFSGVTNGLWHRTDPPAAQPTAQKNATTSQTAQDVTDNQAERRYRLELQQHAQLLVQAARESVDAPSDKATAARAALDDAIQRLAKELADHRKPTGGQPPVQEDIVHSLVAMDKSFLTYAETSDADEQPVTQAVNDFDSYIGDSFSMKSRDEFTAQMVSFKNSVLESIRDFRSSDYKDSYTKQFTAQEEFTNALDHLTAE